MRDPTRRTALRGIGAGLGALALGACDEASEGAPPTPRVAVVGGGIAGVATAWLLDPVVAVDLYEARSMLGGNIRSFTRDDGVVIDLGAQYYSPRVYPTYARLLEHLGVLGEGGTHSFPNTATIGVEGATPTFVSPSVPDRLWPLMESWNLPGVRAFTALAGGAQKLELEDVDWSLTVDEWLPSLDLEPALLDALIRPWLAGINTGAIDLVRDFSARAATVFLGRALGDGPVGDVEYSTLVAGMGAPLRRMVEACAQLRVFVDAPVEGVTRRGERLSVHAPGGPRTEYDAVVLALPGPLAARTLGDFTGAEPIRAALGDIATFDVELALHADPTYVHPEPRMRSLINAWVNDTHAEVSMSMAAAVAPALDGAPVDLWKSWVTHRAQQPRMELARQAYTHIRFDRPTLAAQDRLGPLQGEAGLHFAGGWTQRFDSQETALLSALEVARGLAPQSSRLAALT